MRSGVFVERKRRRGSFDVGFGTIEVWAPLALPLSCARRGSSHRQIGLRYKIAVANQLELALERETCRLEANGVAGSA
jgi:hypothetical protein